MVRKNNQRELQERPTELAKRRESLQFVQSLREVLQDITVVEVNTMVVESITGDKFMPMDSYREIYTLTSSYLEEKGVHPSLRERYLELRRKLELEYALTQADLPENSSILTNRTVNLDTISHTLPDPTQAHKEAVMKTKKLLRNSRFLRSLRKMRELKAALDNRNRALLRNDSKTVLTDLIYAQTIIHFDGQILNRYTQEILDHPHKDQIIAIHQGGVEAGTKQWRSLLGFIMDFITKTAPRQ